MCQGLGLECPQTSCVEGWSPVQHRAEAGLREVTGHEGSDLSSGLVLDTFRQRGPAGRGAAEGVPAALLPLSLLPGCQELTRFLCHPLPPCGPQQWTRQ